MKKLRYLILPLLAFFIINASVLAVDAPLKPLEFSVTKLEKTGEGYPLEFKWWRNSQGTVPDYYVIYFAKGITDDLSKFSKLTKIPYSDQDMFTYKKTFSAGEYSFFMFAIKFGDNDVVLESEKTKIIQVKIEGSDSPYIKIVSTPANEGRITVNTDWKYEVKIQTNLKTAVKYKFSGTVPDGMTIDENEGLVKWKPGTEGTYEVTIVAYSSENNEVKGTQTIKLKVGEGDNKPFITITSKPGNEGKILVNTDWKYEVKISTNVKTTIKYKLTGTIPDGMTIDENSGVIKWKPTTTGSIEVTIVAYSADNIDVKGTQTIKLTVVNSDEKPKEKCAKITGTVKYEDGTAVSGGTIVAWFVKDGKSDYVKFKAVIGSDGTYTIELAEGKYILQVSGEKFSSEYFDNVSELGEATVFEIKCNDAKIVNFTVTKKETPKKYKVSGRVTNSDGTKGVYSIVEFYIESKKDNKEGQPDKKVFQAITDKDGYYTIELFDAYNYVGFAKAKENGTLYKSQYYKGVSSYTEATKISVTGEVTGIDFKLESFEDGEKGKLTGQVVDSNNNGISAQVIAFLVNSDKKEDLKYIYKVSVSTDDQGNFSLENLYYGDYVVQSIPSTKDWAPGYYLVDSYVVKNWKEATKITIAQDETGPITIKHKAKTGEKGVIKLNGKIKKNQTGWMAGADEFLSGSVVYCYEGNDIIDFAISDVDGNFEISELPEGTNNYMIDKVGFDVVTGSIDLNYIDKRIGTIEISLNPDVVLDVDSPNGISSIRLFPMPVSDKLSIISETEVKSVKVFNLLGSDMTVSSAISSSGAIINTSSLNDGVYSLQLTTSKGITIQTFVIAR